ncbi:hypothetical protein AeNC1_016358 [Aphanomyces euteiches]|nr:hypothetical protein AeNC1_016358 [Aphanomyces euteiches]
MASNECLIASVWFSIPATFATGQGFVQSYSKILTCMAGSGLLPAKMHEKHSSLNTPIYAIVLGSIVSYCLCFLDYFYSLDAIFFNTCMVMGSISYTSQCVGYLYLKKNFRTMERKFQSPLGKAGAMCSIFVWVLLAVAVVGFQDDHQDSFIALVAILLICTVYYQFYAKSRQKFSEEERMSLFFAHVANHNKAKRSMNSRKRHHSGGFFNLVKRVAMSKVSTSMGPSNSNPQIARASSAGKMKRSSGILKDPSLIEVQSPPMRRKK